MDDTLHPEVEALVAAVRAGQVYWPGHRPTSIAHDESYTAYEATGPAERILPSLRGDHVRQALMVLANAGDQGWDPRGLRIREVTVTGVLDLNWLTLPFPLGFEGCEFDEWVWADHLEVPQLVFDGCSFESFGGTGISVAKRLLFFDCKGVRQIFLPQSDLGIFELRSESFDEPHEVRLVLDGARIHHLDIDDYAQLHGGVELHTRLADILPSDAFTTVEMERLTLASAHQRTSTSRRERASARVTSPAHYLSAWLAGENDVPMHRPNRWQRTTRWVSRWWSGSVDRAYVPQVWERFAAALDNAGLGDDARELRIEAQRFRSRAQTGRLRQLGSTLLFDLPTRYGYRNSRVGWILGALFLLAAAVVHLNPHSFVATAEVADAQAYPGLWPLAYALDVVVSPISTGQADSWWTGATTGVATTLIVIKVLSWLLGGLFVAGVSSSLKRDQ